MLLDFAQRSSDPGEAAGYFARAEQEIERLDRMTGEMLALSRLEGGLPGERRERLDLAGLVRHIAGQAALDASARNIALACTAPDAVPVDGNGPLLERAVDNLLGNALKFSDADGAVELRVRAIGHEAELCVRDHGPGVPEAELGALFRPFFRGSNAGRAEGLGLGLGIVQRVARVHGGRVTARNAEGGGLEVCLRLPLAEGNVGA